MIDIHKLRDWAFVAFVAILPIVYNNTNLMDLRQFQERSFQLGAIALMSIFVGNIWIGAFLLWNIISLFLNDYTVGLPQVLNIFLGCMIFSVSRSYFKNNKFEMLLKTLAWLCVLNILWIILQSSGIDPLYIGQNANGQPMTEVTFRDFAGLFGIKMASGIFLAIVIPIIASMNILIAPLMAIPIYFCRSSAVALAVFVSINFYIYQTRRKLFIWFFCIGLIIGIFYVAIDYKDDSQTFNSRFSVWHSAIKYSLKRPLGWGPDSYRNYTKQKDFLFYADRDYNHGILTKIGENKAKFEYYNMDNGKAAKKNNGIIENGVLNWWDNPHNEYIQLLFEYGFVGLFILFGLIREMFYRFKFAVKSQELIVITSCLLVYFVTGFVHFPFHLARLACIFPIFLGAYFAKSEVQFNAK